MPEAELTQSPEAVTAIGQLLRAMTEMHCLCRELRDALMAKDAQEQAAREGSSSESEDSEPDTQEPAPGPTHDLHATGAAI